MLGLKIRQCRMCFVKEFCCFSFNIAHLPPALEPSWGAELTLGAGVSDLGGGRGRAWGSIPRLSPAQKVLQEEPTSILYMALGGMVGAVAAGQLTVLLAGGTSLLSSAAAPPIRGELLFPTAGQLTHLSRIHLGARKGRWRLQVLQGFQGLLGR